MTSPAHALAIETATRRLMRVALLLGLTGSIVAVVATLLQGAPATTILLAAAWSSAWTAAVLRPDAVVWLLRRWSWTVPLVAGVSVATISASDGFDSLLKAEANWLAWAAPVVLGTSASLGIAAILSAGLLGAFLLDGLTLQQIVSGPERYTAVTDILNPMIVVLVALAMTGIFRFLLTNASQLLWRARQGDPASSPDMAALLAARPLLALPAGKTEPGEPTPWDRLTPAQQDIVEQLAQGLTPKQIALHRGTQAETVYEQLSAARQRTGARTNEHLVVVAWPLPS